MAKRTLAISVSLSEEQLLTLREKSPVQIETAEFLSGVATGALQDLADGGMLIDGPCMRRIERIIEDPDSATIAERVESSAGMDGDAVIVKWRVDPTYVPALQDIASRQAVPMTVQELAQQGFDWVMDQGWLWQWNPGPRQFRISEKDVQMIAEVIGKSPESITGTDIAKYVRESAELPASAE